MERYIYNIVGLLLLFTGCNGEPSHYSEELLQLESRVDAVPDSVYSRLDSFDTGKMYEADRALFITIRTEAADKLYKEHTTDSLIAEAVKFFEKKHDTPRLAKAWYLAGRIHSDWKEWEEAMNDFLKAQQLTDDSNDYMLRARIASYLGNINWRNRLYLKARYHHQESLQYYTHAKDTTGIASALKCIGETFMAKYQTDSAACFYKQALLMAGITQNKRLLGNIHNCLGYLYKESQQTNQALSELRSAICYSPSNYSIYKDIGSLFIQMGELDSACYYLEQALLSDKLPTRCMANYYLGEVASLKGDSKRAFDYKKKYEQLSDSLFLEKKTEELSGIQQQVLGKKESINLSLNRYY